MKWMRHETCEKPQRIAAAGEMNQCSQVCWFFKRMESWIFHWKSPCFRLPGDTIQRNEHCPRKTHPQIEFVGFGASLQPLVCIWLPEQSCRIAATPLFMLFSCLACPFPLFHIPSLSSHLLKPIHCLLPPSSSPQPTSLNTAFSLCPVTQY